MKKIFRYFMKHPALWIIYIPFAIFFGILLWKTFTTKPDNLLELWLQFISGSAIPTAIFSIGFSDEEIENDK